MQVCAAASGFRALCVSQSHITLNPLTLLQPDLSLWLHQFHEEKCLFGPVTWRIQRYQGQCLHQHQIQTSQTIGMGIKTAECVYCFSFGFLPYRVCKYALCPNSGPGSSEVCTFGLNTSQQVNEVFPILKTSDAALFCKSSHSLSHNPLYSIPVNS